MADSAPGVGTGIASADPFWCLSWHGGFQLLVPANRPSDVISTLVQVGRSGLTVAERTAVVRSWERRFGAVPVALSKHSLLLTLDRPPAAREQARRLAHEQLAFESGTGLEALARALRGSKGRRQRTYWAFP